MGFYRERRKARNRIPQIYSRTKTIVPERKSSKPYLFLFLVLFSLFIYMGFFSSVFKLKNVEVNGASSSEAIKETVEAEVGKNFLTSNIFFINKKLLSNKIKENLMIKEVSIKKIYPSKIQIIITTRKPALVWEENEVKFLVDEEGYAFLEIGEGIEGYHDLPKIKNNLISLNKVGDTVATEDFMKFIKLLTDNFENEIADKIVLIEINGTNTEVTVLTDKNYKVFFDAERSAAIQLKSLAQVKEEAAKAKKKLEYVDLRIETRIFYK